VLVLCGCSRQQTAEAGSQATKAKNQAEHALGDAKATLADGSISARVKTAMMASNRLDTSHINVDTKNRVVYLKGSVTSADQKKLADQIARDTVGGDTKVVSQLQVGKAVSTKKAAPANRGG
jgi:osmotically-inducible protein OsmY